MFALTKTCAKGQRKRIEMEWPPTPSLRKCEEIYTREKLLEVYHTEPGLKRHVAEGLFKPYGKLSRSLQWYWSRRASMEMMARSSQTLNVPVFASYFFIKEQLALMEAHDPHIWKSWNVVLSLQKKWMALPVARIQHYLQLAQAHNAKYTREKV